MVAGIFLTSVVEKTNRRYGGGSSKVFNNAFIPALLIMWHSSKINILYFAVVGAYFENSIRSLTSSTPVLLAASISNTSIWLELIIELQWSQKLSLHKLSIPFSQFKDLATILAIVVLPTPRIPVNKYAFADFSDLIEL